MELQHGIFAAKLYELEQEYGRLLSRLQLLQRERPEQIRQVKHQMQEEYREHSLMLEETARSCRSRTMARLAQLQRDYEQQTSDLAAAAGGDRAEAMTLSAEYAIDYATQAMRYALITALQALELQMGASNETTEGERDKHE